MLQIIIVNFNVHPKVILKVHLNLIYWYNQSFAVLIYKWFLFHCVPFPIKNATIFLFPIFFISIITWRNILNVRNTCKRTKKRGVIRQRKEFQENSMIWYIQLLLIFNNNNNYYYYTYVYLYFYNYIGNGAANVQYLTDWISHDPRKYYQHVPICADICVSLSMYLYTYIHTFI